MARHYLRPDGDDKSDWTEVPAGLGWPLLNDPVVYPAAPSTASNYLEVATNGQTARSTVDSFPLGPNKVLAVRAYAYLIVPSGAAVDVSPNGVTGTSTVRITGPFTGWAISPVCLPATAGQAGVDGLKVQVASVTSAATPTRLYAHYLEVLATPVLGINTNYRDDTYLNDAVTLGAMSVRVECFNGALGGTPGGNSTTEAEAHAVLNNVGLKMLPLVNDYTRAWSDAGWATAAVEAIPYADYGVIEIANEPYIQGIGGRAVAASRDAVGYGAMVRACQEAITATGSTVKVLASAGGPTGFTATWPILDYEKTDLTISHASTGNGWIGDIKAADPGLESIIGGWAIHPYQINLANSGPAFITSVRSFTTLPLWFTEAGVATNPTIPAEEATKVTGLNTYVDTYLLAAPHDVYGVYWYNHKDYFLYGTRPDQGWSLVLDDNSHVPAYAAFQAAATRALAAAQPALGNLYARVANSWVNVPVYARLAGSFVQKTIAAATGGTPTPTPTPTPPPGAGSVQWRALNAPLGAGQVFQTDPVDLASYSATVGTTPRAFGTLTSDVPLILAYETSDDALTFSGGVSASATLIAGVYVATLNRVYSGHQYGRWQATNSGAASATKTTLDVGLSA